jgi:AcrR family transcriptional regulator
MATAPRHRARATRQSGRQTRAALLDAAIRLFAERGYGGVSISEIAVAADCFPSQVTYYFGDKDRLFVEAACRGVLDVRAAIERAARRARTPEGAVRGMVRAATASDAILSFVEAMLLARRRPELTGAIEETFALLHAEAQRAAELVLERHGWTTPAGPAVQSRAFWSAIIGLALERAARGDAFDVAAADAAVRSVLSFEAGRRA